MPSWLIPCLQFGFSSPLFCQIRLSIIELPLDRNVFAHPLVASSSYRQDLNVEIRGPKSRPLTSSLDPSATSSHQHASAAPSRAATSSHGSSVRSTVWRSSILARQQCTQLRIAPTWFWQLNKNPSIRDAFGKKDETDEADEMDEIYEIDEIDEIGEIDIIWVLMMMMMMMRSRRRKK